MRALFLIEMKEDERRGSSMMLPDTREQNGIRGPCSWQQSNGQSHHQQRQEQQRRR
ncbi:uncharacterized protein BDW70DRAFT_126286 [Aspergillus foveolatus]|uniref:uncharacterized protein n=1 Tax=Aspergillus foveolatus TaxID=210207 RepID=UPI003CCCD104